MTFDTSALEATKELNLNYLVLAQSLIRSDREMAMFRLGLSSQIADMLEKLSVQQVVRLADCGQLLCQFSMSTPTLLKLFADKASDLHLERTQAATLLACESAAQLA